MASLSDSPAGTPGAGKRTRSVLSTPSSEEVRPTKRSQGFQPGSYSEAAASLRLAIIKKGYPDSKMVSADVDLILDKILSGVDGIPSGGLATA